MTIAIVLRDKEGNKTLKGRRKVRILDVLPFD